MEGGNFVWPSLFGVFSVLFMAGAMIDLSMPAYGD